MIDITRETKSFPFDLLLEADPSIDKVKGYLGRGDCYIAKQNGEVLGAYVLLQKDSIVEIVNIVVDEGYRGKGIGKKLLQDALFNAIQMGAETVEIGTGNSSIGQLALYQKCGFRMMEIVQGYFEEYEEDIIENGIVCRDMIRLSFSIN
ncbi:GNAT family N-acetyltransferase [Guptibacillus algicola]|uniref:GNAT family N-acetyltransferase n=1 Tax=Guptibacillus algicola TaxID=225844 RepID=UPI001CD1F3E7|nr:GNAT family N-acetyltransferase [Alkalihalobacillus algicola]MCA0989063.1 GNAT family N-acetyltransferase [Alkalihalobacillus algicola]